MGWGSESSPLLRLKGRWENHTDLPSPSTQQDTISPVEVRRDSLPSGRQHKSGGHDSSSHLPPQGPKSKARRPGGNYINSTNMKIHPHGTNMLPKFGNQKHTLKKCLQKHSRKHASKPNSELRNMTPPTPPFGHTRAYLSTPGRSLKLKGTRVGDIAQRKKKA